MQTEKRTSIDWIKSSVRGARSGSLRAHAKLNVTFEILGQREEDGYHSVRTIMQTIELHDVLCLTVLDDTDEIRFTCTSTSDDLKEPSKNLAVKAAELLKKHRAGGGGGDPRGAGVHIELDKRIPIRAGLGGGSSDAAAVLVALTELWELSLSISELTELAASLGSDVPFFLHGGLALCEGRGEIVTPLPAQWPASMRWLLLAKPALGVSTADAYQNLAPKYHSDGRHSQRVREQLAQGRSFDIKDLRNAMAESVLERYPDIARTRDQMLAAGATHVELCGTGSTLWSPFQALSAALQVRDRLVRDGILDMGSIHLTQAHTIDHRTL